MSHWPSPTTLPCHIPTDDVIGVALSLYSVADLHVTWDVVLVQWVGGCVGDYWNSLGTIDLDLMMSDERRDGEIGGVRCETRPQITTTEHSHQYIHLT